MYCIFSQKREQTAMAEYILSIIILASHSGKIPGVKGKIQNCSTRFQKVCFFSLQAMKEALSTKTVVLKLSSLVAQHGMAGVGGGDVSGRYTQPHLHKQWALVLMHAAPLVWALSARWVELNTCVLAYLYHSPVSNRLQPGDWGTPILKDL